MKTEEHKERCDECGEWGERDKEGGLTLNHKSSCSVPERIRASNIHVNSLTLEGYPFY